MSWKKHKKLAEDQMEQGEYYEAAQNFQAAWEQKPKKTELIYQAAEAYYLVNDYRGAAEAYQHVADRKDLDPLIGLKYARSLKQDGQYDKAIAVFSNVSDNYTGQDKAILDEIIQMEIQGAEMAGQLAARQDRNMELIYPGSSINSDDDDFAPYPITPDMLYFSSSKGGKARIYSSQRQGRSWTQADIPANFPVIQNGQYANGTLSPTGDRFYFTICNDSRSWDAMKTRCELFVIKRNGTNWTEPTRLPDYINMEGITSTMPHVVQVGGREILYYSSNREGGRGGMDIWYVVRDLGRNDDDFTFPVNLGPVVNTLGEEITPYYDQEEGTLYFASNGHPSVGGFDIFRSLGEEVNWTIPENAGLPVNSGSNDYGFIINRDHTGGFLVSNRPFGGEKNNTRNADIFEFTIGGNRITLRGNVYDKGNGELLNNISVSLYQQFDDNSENLLITKDFQNGSYLFELLPDRRFRVEVKRSGYAPADYTFATNDPNTLTYGQPVFMTMGEPIMQPAPSVPQNEQANNNPPATRGDQFNESDFGNNNPDMVEPDEPAVLLNNSGDIYTARGTSDKDNLEYTSSAPQHSGTYFKIQLVALGNFDPNNSKLEQVKYLGDVQTEEIVGRGLTRVLLADFFSEEEAIEALNSARSVFSSAYIVKYENGIRYGRVRL
jgi:tetratricopeptide (TPR) repeat protein